MVMKIIKAVNLDWRNKFDDYRTLINGRIYTWEKYGKRDATLRRAR